MPTGQKLTSVRTCEHTHCRGPRRALLLTMALYPSPLFLLQLRPSFLPSHPPICCYVTLFLQTRSSQWQKWGAKKKKNKTKHDVRVKGKQKSANSFPSQNPLRGLKHHSGSAETSLWQRLRLPRATALQYFVLLKYSLNPKFASLFTCNGKWAQSLMFLTKWGVYLVLYSQKQHGEISINMEEENTTSPEPTAAHEQPQNTFLSTLSFGLLLSRTSILTLLHDRRSATNPAETSAYLTDDTSIPD